MCSQYWGVYMSGKDVYPMVLFVSTVGLATQGPYVISDLQHPYVTVQLEY